MRVVLGDVRDEDGSKTAAALNGENLPVRYTHLDVTDEAGWAKVIADD
jgi:3alpha(or 20beta)-hydroxysteroid dehydrogenase